MASQKERLLSIIKEDIDPEMAGELLDCFARGSYLQGYSEAIDVVKETILGSKDTFDPYLLIENLTTKLTGK